METYRQSIRAPDGRSVTMVGVVSDLTELVRGYYQNWRRPLHDRREDLQKAKRLGRIIIGIAVRRAWREDALQDVLGSLRVQDKQMHHLATNILTDAKVAYQLTAQKELHSELQLALQTGTTHDIWQRSAELYQLSKRMLTPKDYDSSYSTFFLQRMEELRQEDPITHRRIALTLFEVGSSRSEGERRELPHPRARIREVEVYRSG